MRKLIIHIIPFLAVVMPMALWAQTHRIMSNQIASLEVNAGDDWQNMPVIKLDQEVPLVIDFDDLSHEYRRLSYKIEHCEADWQPSSDLFASDYLDGFSDNLLIDDYAESINTATLYTHYRLQIPNADVRLKMSGNYRLAIYDDNDSDGAPMLEVCFMVTEDTMGVGLSLTTNTDIDVNNAHQQVGMRVNYNNLVVTDPDRQLKTIVIQNGRWQTARRDAQPQYRTPSSLEWSHCRDYIFAAGNEFHKFEYLDIHRNSLGIDHTGFDGTNYHAWVNVDEPRQNYVYDVSGNGSFVIRNSDNYENDTASEYFMAHFTYHTGMQLPGRLYVSGWWTQDALSPEYEMMWNEEAHAYECAVSLKMGYYSYQYLFQRDDGTITPSPLDGNYYQTANTYQAFVYYRETGGRTDRLVGYANLH